MRLETIVNAMDFSHLRIVNDVLMNKPGLKNVRQYHAFKKRIIKISKDGEEWRKIIKEPYG